MMMGGRMGAPTGRGAPPPRGPMPGMMRGKRMFYVNCLCVGKRVVFIKIVTFFSFVIPFAPTVITSLEEVVERIWHVFEF